MPTPYDFMSAGPLLQNPYTMAAQMLRDAMAGGGGTPPPRALPGGQFAPAGQMPGKQGQKINTALLQYALMQPRTTPSDYRGGAGPWAQGYVYPDISGAPGGFMGPDELAGPWRQGYTFPTESLGFGGGLGPGAGAAAGGFSFPSGVMF